jgi:hypothetical protein
VLSNPVCCGERDPKRAVEPPPARGDVTRRKPQGERDEREAGIGEAVGDEYAHPEPERPRKAVERKIEVVAAAQAKDSRQLEGKCHYPGPSSEQQTRKRDHRDTRQFA